jgi:hypothetical protein
MITTVACLHTLSMTMFRMPVFAQNLLATPVLITSVPRPVAPSWSPSPTTARGVGLGAPSLLGHTGLMLVPGRSGTPTNS